jgi:hypothetical protein
MTLGGFFQIHFILIGLPYPFLSFQRISSARIPNPQHAACRIRVSLPPMHPGEDA